MHLELEVDEGHVSRGSEEQNHRPTAAISSSERRARQVTPPSGEYALVVQPMNPSQAAKEPPEPGIQRLRPPWLQEHEAVHDEQRVVQIHSTKKYPANADEIKGEQDRDDAIALARGTRDCTEERPDFFPGQGPLSMDDEAEAMKPSPENKNPRSAMPKTTEQHREQDVPISEEPAVTVSA